MHTEPSSFEVLIPLLNPNETDALLVDLHVQEGQAVNAGDSLCTLETTKSTAVLAADQAGYVAGLRLSPGQTVHAGERLCYLASSPEWTPPAPEPVASQDKNAPVPEGLRITQPALQLAQSAGLDLGRLPLGVLVTEKLVQEMLKGAAPSRLMPPDSVVDPTAILVYGGGGHGKALIDLIRTLHAYRVVAVVDDGLSPGSLILDVPVRGGSQALADLYAQGVRLAVNAVGGIGNLDTRLKVFERLAQAGFSCPTLIHPSAVVEPSAHLSTGIQLMPLAYAGSEAQVGYGVIINTGAIVSHDCRIGDYANLSPGAILAGEVEIGSGALIGMGATVNLRVKVGALARIGNGATVKRDVPEGGIVRAGGVWPE
jgi:sugar O-acyltransferase (sialic acid O-acetyltransferase NeuD family)